MDGNFNNNDLSNVLDRQMAVPNYNTLNQKLEIRYKSNIKERKKQVKMSNNRWLSTISSGSFEVDFPNDLNQTKRIKRPNESTTLIKELQDVVDSKKNKFKP